MERQPEDTTVERNLEELEEWLEELSKDDDAEETVSEIKVLQSIYGDHSIIKWVAANRLRQSLPTTKNDERIRYVVQVSLTDDPKSSPEETAIRILVSLPLSYPKDGPPQLQLLSKYIGAFRVDSELFGAVIRTFMSQGGVEWLPDTVSVFDGVENVKERCFRWYSDRLSEDKAREILRKDERADHAPLADERPDIVQEFDAIASEPETSSAVESTLLPHFEIITAEPVIDRKSVFVGRACRITDPSEVPAVLSYLMSDRRIARAAHPIIHAWRCTVNGVSHQDNDDDGESAAGGRLAHLLQILEVDNVLVIVTRYFGGILLGADRFKHINQAARNVLELGGFLDNADYKKVGRTKKRH